MSHSGLDFQEFISSQFPALALLSNLGYVYLSPAEALAARGGKPSRVILSRVLEERLRFLNVISFKGRVVPFSDANIAKALERLQGLVYGSLQVSARQAFDLLTLGVALEQVIDGDKKSYSMRFIDWQNPSNNVFHVTQEFSVERLGSSDSRRPDVVVFVNGIPLAVLECKRPDLKNAVLEAVSQQIRNQKSDQIPHFFMWSQVLLAVSGAAAKFATTDTNAEFWADWREEDLVLTGSLEALVNKPLPVDLLGRILESQSSVVQTRVLEVLASGSRVATAQDKLIQSLLMPTRLLDIIRGFVVFDAGLKKIARHQQFFAVKEAALRVLGRNADGSRRGGVIWHTTGSGKSLTMVMLAKALTLEPSMKTAKVILVTDRVDLDVQIRDTFVSCGVVVRQAKSGRHLLELIRENKTQVITTIIDKFAAVAKENFKDASADIFVLIDESHRSQYGSANALMQNVFPLACYLGFTGTPLLKREKSTADKFGGILHSYSMRRAVEDGAVVPLKYEGRYSELRGAKEQLDKWFDRVTRNLTVQQKTDLKKKFRSAETVLEANSRLSEIAFDIGQHFKSFTASAEKTGLKGQFAVSSKLDAVRYKKQFETWGDVSVAVLISAPDTREDHERVDESHVPEVQAFWQDMINRFGSPEQYQKTLIDQFKSDSEPQILIVVDKLLTGFDSPRNSVLYLDKKLREHSILQAIARVNRVFEGKDYGLILDYRGIFGHLSEALDMYAALEAEGFEVADLEGILEPTSLEIGLLSVRHSHLWDVFKDVNKSDLEALALWLLPEDRREVFYEVFGIFVKTLKLALANADFLRDTAESVRKRYLNDLQFFLNLRKNVKERYGESVDYSIYEKQIRQLILENVGAEAVITLIEPVSIFDQVALEQELNNMGSVAARADAIASRIKRAISERLAEDPVFYKRLSQLVEEAILAHRAARLSDLEFLEVQRQYLHEMRSQGESNRPEALRGNDYAAAYYGLAVELLQSSFAESDVLIATALEFDMVIKRHRIRDWGTNETIKKKMIDEMDDYLFKLEQQKNARIAYSLRDELFEKILAVAQHRDKA
jgi:type I restriction enzyme, R subunit